jgi:predicted acetyltransferase
VAHVHQTHPIDRQSAELLASRDLELRLVDTDDARAHHAWLHSDARGFHGAAPSDEDIEIYAAAFADRRTTGVWDAAAPPAASPDSTAQDAAAQSSIAPVATVSSWPAELTVSPGRTVTAWAISSVTVSPTHRRRGIARALIESELRTAHALGHPLSALTVSESTIYERFGFGAAAFATDWTIDTRRTGWAGPAASGRLRFVSAAEARAQIAAVYDRARLALPGEVEVWGGLWDATLGLAPELLDTEPRSASDRGRTLRIVRYDDEGGAAQGFVIYSVSGGEVDFSAHRLQVHYLLAASDEAYAALWRFVIEIDLVTEVKAHLLSVDEALTWQLSDPRAATVTRDNHLWVRILDVVAALEAREYSAGAVTPAAGQPTAPGVLLGLDVSDQLGFTTGRYLLEIGATGNARAVPVAEIPVDAAALRLGISELSALYLGGVSAATLVRAGRVTESHDGDAIAADRLFRAERAPRLSVWF